MISQRQIRQQTGGRAGRQDRSGEQVRDGDEGLVVVVLGAWQLLTVRVIVACIAGQDDAVRRRVEQALRDG